MMIRLLLVDDQPTMRTGLRMMLEAEADLVVVGEAGAGQAAIDLATTLGPDVVLMDVRMPHVDAMSVASQLHRILPQTKIIVLSIHDNAAMQARAKDAGATAFVSKFLPVSQLLVTIRQVAGGCGPTRTTIEE